MALGRLHNANKVCKDKQAQIQTFQLGRYMVGCAVGKLHTHVAINYISDPIPPLMKFWIQLSWKELL